MLMISILTLLTHTPTLPTPVFSLSLFVSLIDAYRFSLQVAWLSCLLKLAILIMLPRGFLVPSALPHHRGDFLSCAWSDFNSPLDARQFKAGTSNTEFHFPIVITTSGVTLK